MLALFFLTRFARWRSALSGSSVVAASVPARSPAGIPSRKIYAPENHRSWHEVRRFLQRQGCGQK